MAVLKIRNADDTAWIVLGGAGGDSLQDADGDTLVQVEESADEDVVRIDAGGSEIWQGQQNGILKPLQPAFLVYPAGDQNNMATGSSVTIVWDTEVFDQGSDFNTSTYTFTAPITGRYLLTVGIRFNAVDTACSYVRLTIVTSNRTYYHTMHPKFSSDPLWKMDITTIADMDASDTAIVQWFQSGGAQQTDVSAGESFFSGSLIC